MPVRKIRLRICAAAAPGPLQLKSLHGKISGYFNLDNGGGRIRGIYAENNVAVKPVFESWLAPFADLGANTVTLRHRQHRS
jgi:hypothetical protein